jgi:3(or 17)beta-hydroxysteroid dehydrogenase
MSRLTGKTCVITGAGSGIGLAIARAFSNENAKVIVTDKDEVTGSIAADELDATFIRLDVRNEDDWTNLASQVPTADVVVNNAGVTGFEEAGQAHDPENATLQDWRSVHAVNLDGTFLGCRYAIRAMKAGGMVRSSTYLRDPVSWACRWQPLMLHPRLLFATTPSLLLFIEP